MWCVVIVYENVSYGEDGASSYTEVSKVIGPFGSKDEAEVALKQLDSRDLHWTSDVFEMEAP